MADEIIINEPENVIVDPAPGLADPRHLQPGPVEDADHLAHPELEPLRGPTEASDPDNPPLIDDDAGPALIDPTVRSPGPLDP